MSKIPQGEWDAIAARHAQGETIARIAQDYGCTAPAIHYILKRQKQRARPTTEAGASTAAPAAPSTVAPLTSRPMPELRPAAEVRRSSEVHALELRPAPEPRPASELRPISELRPAAELRPARTNPPQREEVPALTIVPTAGERHASGSRSEQSGEHPQLHAGAAHAIPQPAQPRGLEASYPRDLRSPDEDRTGNPPIRPAAKRGSALKAGLDAELQNQMEEAIETFRSHMHAALTDLSPAGREKLRAAASELMRMAARTMIVLDRMSASHEHNERAAGRAPDYPRSAHAR
jgi:transposase-like protein